MHLLKTLLTRFVKVGTLEVYDVEGKAHVFSGKPGPKVAIRLKDRAVWQFPVRPARSTCQPCNSRSEKHWSCSRRCHRASICPTMLLS